jgi:acyl-CoA thioesterase I
MRFLVALALFTATFVAPQQMLFGADPTPVLFLGDSLTEGVGVAKEQAFPEVLATLSAAQGKPINVINAGVSGATSASGLSRLKWHLKGKVKPDIVVLALGANDGLRGLDLQALRKNLEDVIVFAKKHSLKVVLAGMRVPPNYGIQYSERFAATYDDLARAHQIPIIPFLLAGVGGEAKLNQPDGIHPNAEGHKILAKNVLSVLAPLL